MSDFEWNQWKQDDKGTEGDPYVKFTEDMIDEPVEGTITDIQTTNFGDPTKARIPVLFMKTAKGEKIVNCDKTVLLRLLAEKSPQRGDGIKITYKGEAKTSKPGRSPAKLFEVDVTPATLTKQDQAPPTSTSASEPGDDPPF